MRDKMLHPSQGGKLTDPSYKGNGKGEGEMPAFRLFEHENGQWVETDPVTGEKEPIDKQDILDDMDIDDDDEEGES
jgi:hypothetical protein